MSVPGPPAIRIAVVAVLATLTMAGCRVSHTQSAPSAKSQFVSAADRICANHAQRVIAWLVEPRSGSLARQAAATNEGIFKIISTTVTRLETLGQAPGPNAGAFSGYVGTLKARASLYKLTGIANQRRDDITALRFERRISQIDELGDRQAHRYGLRICGTGGRDIAKAFSAGGWSKPPAS